MTDAPDPAPDPDLDAIEARYRGWKLVVIEPEEVLPLIALARRQAAEIARLAKDIVAWKAEVKELRDELRTHRD